MKKLLVIAGTHQRETEFSHSVVDMLIDLEKGSRRPCDTLIGEDEATKAVIWDTARITIAKLYPLGNGEPTEDWLKKQTPKRIGYLEDFRKRCGTYFPPRIAETFGGEGQWTSVHDLLIHKYSPLFFVDLHSYHNNTRGIIGKGMQINSHSDRRFDNIIASALKKAQLNDPEVYGKEQSIEQLRQLREESAREKEIEKLNENGWWFVSWGKPEPRGNYYCFEAKHWQKNQQEATANFILEYLVPEANAFQAK